MTGPYLYTSAPYGKDVSDTQPNEMGMHLRDTIVRVMRPYSMVSLSVCSVVEGYCCFLVIERILEGRGELEFVVEGVDGDE